ncbi:tetraspanin-18-like isoform X2 [Macrosteles quadrilineatus]|nr:tetraspanin-18-like isoform X2 [Macrosteles quadrilineatus]
MALCTTPTCSRGIVIFFNFLFWVTGSCLILLGFYVLLDASKAHLLHLVATEGEAKYCIVVISYTLFLIGCGMMGLVFMGCCKLHSKPWLITTYLTIMVVLELIEIIAILVIATSRSSMLIDLQGRLSDQLKTDYGHQNNNNINTHGNNVFTQSLDYAQYTFNCCGVEGPHEYSLTRWYNDSGQSKEPRNVPITCCARFTSEENSAGSPISVVSRVFHGTVEEVWQNPKLNNETACQRNRPRARYSTGCWEPIKEWFLSQSLILMLVLIVIMGLQLVSIGFFVVLLKNVCELKDQAPSAPRRTSSGG